MKSKTLQSLVFLVIIAILLALSAVVKGQTKEQYIESPGDYNADQYDVMKVNAADGKVTIHMPPVGLAVDREFTIEKTDRSSNPVVCDGFDSELVLTFNAFALRSENQSITLVSDGKTWKRK